MKRILLTVLTASLCAAVPSFAQDEAAFDASTAGDGKTIAFVGKKVFIKEIKTDGKTRLLEKDPSTGLITTHSGILYQSRFKIIEIVSGEFDETSIDFLTYGHWAPPGFVGVEDPVLIFVDDGPETFRSPVEYGIYYDVSRTSDGDWAACGDTYIQNNPNREYKEPLEVIPFLDPIEINIADMQRRAENTFRTMVAPESPDFQVEIGRLNADIDSRYEPPIWVRDGSKATCRLGTRVADLYKFQNETRFMPDRREDICRDRYSAELDALGNDYKSNRAILKDCTDLLEIQNLP